VAYAFRAQILRNSVLRSFVSLPPLPFITKSRSTAQSLPRGLITTTSIARRWTRTASYL
ncbi:hypothetical protein BDZ91DRAFT_734274, partial [Kalaharituber pfeilii]